VRSQEQAFRAYYASMTEGELLQTAANRNSFIGVAQKILAQELDSRGLTPSPPPQPPARHSAVWNWGHHLVERFHHPHHPAPT